MISGDGIQREIQLAVEQDLLELLELVAPVQPVPGAGPSRRRQQADRVVVMEGPDADARQSASSPTRCSALIGPAPGLLSHARGEPRPT
jgi:hypothetical protein